MAEAIPWIAPALDVAGGVLGYQQGNKQQSMAQAAFAQQDPFKAYRPIYGQQLLDLMKDPSSITKQPGYQFQFQQGEQALDRSQAAKGFLNSGNAATAAIQYGQNFAQSWLQPYEQFLAGLAGSGISPNAGPALSGMNAGVETSGSALNSILYGAGSAPWGNMFGGGGHTLGSVAGGSAGTPATAEMSGLPPGAFGPQTGDIVPGSAGADLYGAGGVAPLQEFGPGDLSALAGHPVGGAATVGGDVAATDSSATTFGAGAGTAAGVAGIAIPTYLGLTTAPYRLTADWWKKLNTGLTQGVSGNAAYDAATPPDQQEYNSKMSLYRMLQTQGNDTAIAGGASGNKIPQAFLDLAQQYGMLNADGTVNHGWNPGQDPFVLDQRQKTGYVMYNGHWVPGGHGNAGGSAGRSV